MIDPLGLDVTLKGILCPLKFPWDHLGSIFQDYSILWRTHCNLLALMQTNQYLAFIQQSMFVMQIVRCIVQVFL